MDRRGDRRQRRARRARPRQFLRSGRLPSVGRWAPDQVDGHERGTDEHGAATHGQRAPSAVLSAAGSTGDASGVGGGAIAPGLAAVRGLRSWLPAGARLRPSALPHRCRGAHEAGRDLQLGDRARWTLARLEDEPLLAGSVAPRDAAVEGVLLDLARCDSAAVARRAAGAVTSSPSRPSPDRGLGFSAAAAGTCPAGHGRRSRSSPERRAGRRSSSTGRRRRAGSRARCRARCARSRRRAGRCPRLGTRMRTGTAGSSSGGLSWACADREGRRGRDPSSRRRAHALRRCVSRASASTSTSAAASPARRRFAARRRHAPTAERPRTCRHATTWPPRPVRRVTTRAEALPLPQRAGARPR